MVDHARPHAPIAARPGIPIQPAPFVDPGLEARKARRSLNAAQRMKPTQGDSPSAPAAELFPLPKFDSEPIPSRSPAADSWVSILDPTERPSPFATVQEPPRSSASRVIVPPADQSPLAARLAALHKSRQILPRASIDASAASPGQDEEVARLRAQIEAAARSRMKPKARVPLLTEIASPPARPPESQSIAASAREAAAAPATAPSSALPEWAKNASSKGSPTVSEAPNVSRPWTTEASPSGFIASYGYFLSRQIGAPLMLVIRNFSALALAFLHLAAPAFIGWLCIRATAHGQDIFLAGGTLFAGVKILWAYFAFSFAWTSACMGLQTAYAKAKSKIESNILIR